MCLDQSRHGLAKTQQVGIDTYDKLRGARVLLDEGLKITVK